MFNTDGILTVKFITEQLKQTKETREKRANAGRISAEKRKALQQVSTNKKGERRKKKEDSREKIEEKKTKTKPQIHDAAVAAIDWSSCDDEEIKEAFLMFLDERRAHKKYVTDNAIKGLFNSLKGFSKAEQLEAINRAVAGSHQALYPKREGGAITPQQVKPAYGVDDGQGVVMPEHMLRDLEEAKNGS